MNRRNFITATVATAVAGKAVSEILTSDVDSIEVIGLGHPPNGYTGKHINGFLCSDNYLGIKMKFYRWSAPEDMGSDVLSYRVSARMNLKTYGLGKKITYEAMKGHESPITELRAAMKRTIDKVTLSHNDIDMWASHWKREGQDLHMAVHKPEGAPTVFI